MAGNTIKMKDLPSSESSRVTDLIGLDTQGQSVKLPNLQNELETEVATLGSEVGEVIELLFGFDETVSYTKSSGYQNVAFTIPEGTYLVTMTDGGDIFRVSGEGVVIKTFPRTGEEVWKVTKEISESVTKVTLYKGSIRFQQTDAMVETIGDLTTKVSTLVEEDSAFEVSSLKGRELRQALSNDFSWKEYDKAYFTFCVDDDINSTIASTFIAKSAPLCLAPSVDKNADYTIKGDIYQGKKSVFDDVLANGGEIFVHSSDPITSSSTDMDYDFLFRRIKQYWYRKGIDANGVITPGGAGYNTADFNKCVEYMRPYFRYSDNFGTGTGVTQYYHPRKWIKSSEIASLDAFKELVDRHVANKTWCVFFFHPADTLAISLDDAIDYIKSKNAEIVTYKTIHDKFGTTKLNAEKIDDAPKDGEQYVRMDGEWVKSRPSADSYTKEESDEKFAVKEETENVNGKIGDVHIRLESKTSKYQSIPGPFDARFVYHIVNTTPNRIKVNFDDGTYDTITTTEGRDIRFNKNVMEIGNIVGEGYVQIDSVKELSNSAFVKDIVHTTSDGWHQFVGEFAVVNPTYDSYRLQISIANSWIRFFGKKDETETAITTYLKFDKLVSGQVIKLDDGIFCVLDMSAKPSFDGSTNLVNWELDKNTLVKQELQAEELRNSVVGKVDVKVGKNIFDGTYTDGAGLMSDGNMSKNSAWVGKFGVTEFIPFGDREYISCYGCVPNVGFTYAVYDKDKKVLDKHYEGNVSCTAQKIEGAVYARFTLNLSLLETTQVEYDSVSTEYEPYSPIAGYIQSTNKIFYCGATRKLKTLREGIREATKQMDCVLYVDEGVYDLVEEFGQEWFDNLTSASTMSGLQLKNNIHIIFSPNSKVVSHYTGNNQYAMSLYSPFNASEGGFTLENMQLESSRCRYSIHDERNGMQGITYSKYLNCRMKLDNSENTAWPNETCIGGGLGSETEVIVEGCVFENAKDGRGGVSYHCSNKTSIKNFASKVIIRDNYFINGTVTIDEYRQDSESENDSVYIVTNNRFSKRYDGTNSEGIFDQNLTNPKAKLLAWNNKIG